MQNIEEKDNLFKWKEGRFPLGKVVATAGAHQVLTRGEMLIALIRHHSGDWGILCAEDKATNEEAVKNGDRILSKYKSASGADFYIITEWDRSVTTILLVEEY